jgi:serine/threonine protein kinase
MQMEEDMIFDKHYRLIKLLGSGGFSEVWLAEDLNIEIGSFQVALKIYAPGGGMDDQTAASFIVEFLLVYDMNHTNLLRSTAYGVFNRMPYLVLPYCKQGSSSKLTGNISEEEAWNFLHDVAAGLAYLHKPEPPVIHQDIKPANVLIAQDGTYMITDFGVSTKARNTLRNTVNNANTTGGTPAYMAPERFSKTPDPIKASDVWALGASLFELITGDVPFGDGGGLIQKSGAAIPLITEGVSKDLKKIIKRCLQKEPWDRPTAEEILKWTEQHSNGEKIRFGGHSGKSSKAIIWIVGVVVVVAAAAFVGEKIMEQIEEKAQIELAEKERKAQEEREKKEEEEREKKAEEERDRIAREKKEAEEKEQDEKERDSKASRKKEQGKPQVKDPQPNPQLADEIRKNNLLKQASTAFGNANYEGAVNLYLQVKNLDKDNTEGYTRFLNKAKSLSEIVSYDNNVKALLLKAQRLQDTSEIRSLIDKCN